MKKLVIEEVPDIIFWKKYSELWYSSKDKSPFQAPLLLQYFSSNNKKVFAVQLIIDEKLAGAFFLSKNNNNYSFLSDLKTDFNFFVFHRDCMADDLEFFLLPFSMRHGDENGILHLIKFRIGPFI